MASNLKIMEKEFIPYEQALALKELGFNEWCFGYYDDSERFWFLEVIKSSLPREYNLALLYQQAFRWFREKYGLNNFIYHYKKEGVLNFAYNINDSIFESDFKTYEEAELKCLKKLIEIVKNKSK